VGTHGNVGRSARSRSDTTVRQGVEAARKHSGDSASARGNRSEATRWVDIPEPCPCTPRALTHPSENTADDEHTRDGLTRSPLTEREARRFTGCGAAPHGLPFTHADEQTTPRPHLPTQPQARPPRQPPLCHLRTPRRRHRRPHRRAAERWQSRPRQPPACTSLMQQPQGTTHPTTEHSSTLARTPRVHARHRHANQRAERLEPFF